MHPTLSQNPATGMIYANASDTIQVGNTTVNNAQIASQLRNMAMPGYIISVHFVATPVEIPNLGLSLTIPAITREEVLDGKVRIVQINPMEINEIVGDRPSRTFVSGYDIAASIVNDYRTKAFSYSPNAHPAMLVSESPNITEEQLRYLLDMEDRYAQAFIQVGDAKNASGEAKFITSTFYAAVRWLNVRPKWAETAYTDNLQKPCWSCRTMISDEALICNACGTVQDQRRLDASLAARGIRKSATASEPTQNSATETRSTDNAEVTELRKQLAAMEKMIQQLVANREGEQKGTSGKAVPEPDPDTETLPPPVLPPSVPTRPLPKPANSK